MAKVALTCLYNDRPEDKSGWQIFQGETVEDALTALVAHFGFMPANPVKIIER